MPYFEALLTNTVQDYLIAFAIFAGLLVVLKIIEWLLFKHFKRLAKRSATDLDDTAIQIVQGIKPPVYVVIAAYFALRSLTLGDLVVTILNGVLAAVIVYQVVESLQILVEYLVRRRLMGAAAEEGNDGMAMSAASVIKRLVAVVFWVIGALFILSNFGVNVTSLVASLGIGGLAVALAAQNVLGDLFASLSIYLDKPFQVGETIKVGNVTGSVKHIGIKTTRLKALSGEEVVLSNKEITSQQINNFKRMERRRVSFDIGVTYETKAELVRKVPQLIQEAVGKVAHMEFGRAHFKSFGDSALIFEIVYYIDQSDYETYMDAQQDLNFIIKEHFEAEGIEFAYPTQMVYEKRLEQ